MSSLGGKRTDFRLGSLITLATIIFVSPGDILIV